jgi:hypothetical protein
MTLAFGLFVKTATTVATPFSLKCRMMFSALVPEPEAKIKIFFINFWILILQKKG